MIVRPRAGSSLWRAQSWPLFCALLLLFALLLPSWKIGFVCEDYCHLVEETARLPLFASLDGLHRPLRNIVLKLAYDSLGLNSAPYHLAIIFLHLAAVALLYRFMLRLGSSRFAALVAAVLFGFFPRNHQAMFWVSVGVDSIVAICALTAGAAFLDFLEQGGARSYCVALFAFVFALGFKETGIAILPLLFLIELAFARERRFSLRRAALHYLPFIAIAGGFVLWVAGAFGRAPVAQTFYSAQSISQTIKMAIKFFLNMALPFNAPVEARDLLHQLPLLFALLVIAIGGALAIFRLVPFRKILFTCGWVVVTMAPTVGFGFYNDRYLCFPFMGVAMLLGFLTEEFVRRRSEQPLACGAVLLLLVAYTALASARLVHYERSWAAAGEEIRLTMTSAHRLHPRVPNDSVISFVNLTHSREKGQIYIFNVGLNGTLWAYGYPPSVTGRRTFAVPDPREERLVRRLLSCREKISAPPDNRYTLLLAHGLRDVTSRCAEVAVEQSQREAPDLWK